jgi:hypothetical protein
VPTPDPVSEISPTGVGVANAVGSGVADGVPGPGVGLGVRVFVGVPGTGVLVRGAAGTRVAGTRVAGRWVGGGMGLMVTMGVTGRSVGVGIEVDVDVGVAEGVTGEGVNVGVGGSGVLVTVGVGVGVPSISSKVVSARKSPCTAITVWGPNPATSTPVGVTKSSRNAPSPATVAVPNRKPGVSQNRLTVPPGSQRPPVAMTVVASPATPCDGLSSIKGAGVAVGRGDGSGVV